MRRRATESRIKMARTCDVIFFLLGFVGGLVYFQLSDAKEKHWSDNLFLRGEPRERDKATMGTVISLKRLYDGGDGSDETAYHSRLRLLRSSNMTFSWQLMSDGSKYKEAVTKRNGFLKVLSSSNQSEIMIAVNLELREINWVNQDPLFMPRRYIENIWAVIMDYYRREVLTSVKWSPENPLQNFEPVYAWKQFELSTRNADGDDANYDLIGKTGLDQSDRTLYKAGSDVFEDGYPSESRHNGLFYPLSHHSYNMNSFEDRLFSKDIIKSDETEKEVIIAAQCKKMGLKIVILHEERLGDTCYQGSGDQRQHTFYSVKHMHVAEKPWNPIALLALISLLLLLGIKKVAIYLPWSKVTNVKGQTGGVVVVGDYTTVNNYHYHHQSKW